MYGRHQAALAELTESALADTDVSAFMYQAARLVADSPWAGSAARAPPAVAISAAAASRAGGLASPRPPAPWPSVCSLNPPAS